MNLQEKLEQGIAAAEAGRKKEARKLLAEVVQADENRLEAWLWLSQVVDSLEDKIVCLENALTLDPHNQLAQDQLSLVKSRQEKLFAPTYAPGDEEPPPQVVPLPEPPLEIKAVYPHQPDEFDNPWLCSYCTAPTRPQDKVCPACRHALIIRQRMKEERTVWLWRGIFLQFTLAFILLALGLVYFALIARLNGFPSPFPFLPAYFGRPVDQPEELKQIILTLFPPWAFWGGVGATVYSLLLMLLLYFRVPNGHILYLINGGAMLIVGLLGAILFYYSLPIVMAFGVVMLIAAAQLFITMNLWYDFTFVETRLRLVIDPGVKGHTSFFISGRNYSEKGMWGRAVIHLRRAIAAEPGHPLYHLALIVAYMNIKRYDLAQKALTRAEELEPHSEKIAQLKKELAIRLGRAGGGQPNAFPTR
ncbi:MAG: hypothetical protein JW953_10615 [Anaerolineae bacterium]|nr:hypothetical protein [Anaerolineae bacterium]